jgi:peptidoglycan hydrolase CwlO-like protein
MEFLSVEMLEKLLSPKDLMNIAIIWFLLKGKVATHFSSIENSLKTIGKNIESLKNSILDLEKSQTKKITELNERMTKLEEKK